LAHGGPMNRRERTGLLRIHTAFSGFHMTLSELRR
jgi:hypothetical protein